MLITKATTTQQSPAAMTPESLKVTVNIFDSLCVASICQTFVNTSNIDIDSQTELCYNFPKDDTKHFVEEMLFSIGDKSIRSKVMEKAMAQEVYDDSIATGKATILMSENKEQEFYQIELGNVLPG